MADSYDITGKIGELYHINTPDDPAEWPMYSFSRPSSILWNAIGERLTAKGWSEVQIREWLQSKDTRWALDGSLGDAIVKLGQDYADGITEP